MDNPLLKPTVLEISPAEEQKQKLEILTKNETSLYDLQRRKAAIEQKRQDLDIDRREQNLESVEWLNQRIYGLITAVTDPDTTERIASNIESGKDLNEFVKAAQGVVKLRDDMLDRAYDNGGNIGKKKKIAVQFQSQGVQVMVGVETDE